MWKLRTKKLSRYFKINDRETSKFDEYRKLGRPKVNEWGRMKERKRDWKN